MSKMRIAVIFGGVSSEHDISLLSVTSVIKNIPRDLFEVVCIGITKQGRWLYYPGNVDLIATGDWHSHPDCTSAIISPDRSHKGIIKIMEDGQTSLLQIDCVFPVLHGKNGEDGTIQGLLALSGIPYVGCDTLSSASCMDKAVTHTILDHIGIKTAKWLCVTHTMIPTLGDFCTKCEETLGFPMFVKPANAGSSIGVSRASNRKELKEAIKHAFSHDKKVLVEEEIIGAEVECAVLGNDRPEASIVGEICACSEFYDYDAKYVSGTSQLFIPARITEEQQLQVRTIAVQAYQALGCSGLARVDFFVTKAGEIYLNEPNTMPGFTNISMYPKMWDKSGLTYPDLIEQLITLAIERADSE